MEKLREQETDASAVALGVIRGEMPLVTLSDIGVQLSYQDGACRLDSNISGVIVTPMVNDLAQGLLTYRDDSDELRLWAFFILAESGVDFAEVESHPQGELLIEALWDASSQGDIAEDVIKVAETLVSTPTPRWK